MRLFLPALALALTAGVSAGPVAAAEDPLPDVPWAQTAEAASDPPDDLEDLDEPTVVTTQDALPAPEPSAEVYPLPADGVYRVEGGGFGHRIGMSQWGAHGAGLAGLQHPQILDFYYPGTLLETWSATQIRVGITIDDDGVTRVSHRPGLHVGAAPDDPTVALPADRSQWRVRATDASPASCVLEGYDGTSWEAYQPEGMPSGCPVSFSSPTEGTVDLYLPGGSRRVYRGTLTATHHDGGITTVNHLGTEDYLRSVVSAEMGPSFHPQALSAQAVAARTYAEASASAAHYDICDTTWCQAYRGRGARNADGTLTSYEYPASSEAVDATAGEVLTYDFPHGRRLATTMYSASTGGQTIAGSAGHGYLLAQPDPHDATPANPRHRWEAELPREALESRYDIHRVERVQVLTRDGVGDWGGRILTARVEGFTADGDYTYAHATGNGLMLANYWPTHGNGLSSDYFTFTTAPAPPEEAERIGGDDRYATAAAAAARWPSGVPVVYVVSGQDYPDALAAGARAGVEDAAVLLVTHGQVPAATARVLGDLQPHRLVVVGGETVVSQDVLDALRPHTTTGRVDRVAGDDRYLTAAALAEAYPAGVDRVLLASGEDYPDALAGAAVAHGEQLPLLLTRADGLPEATAQALERLAPREVVVLGGERAISDTTLAEAAAFATQGARRVAGADRYGTAAALAREFPEDTGTAVVAVGSDFPDAIVAAATAGRDDAPVVLTPGRRLVGQTRGALTHLEPSAILVLGGRSAILDEVVDELGDYLR